MILFLYFSFWDDNTVILVQYLSVYGSHGILFLLVRPSVASFHQRLLQLFVHRDLVVVVFLVSKTHTSTPFQTKPRNSLQEHAPTRVSATFNIFKAKKQTAWVKSLTFELVAEPAPPPALVSVVPLALFGNSLPPGFWAGRSPLLPESLSRARCTSPAFLCRLPAVSVQRESVAVVRSRDILLSIRLRIHISKKK